MKKISKKIKILHITGAMNVGGTETMLINLYRKINKEIQFDFISYNNKDAYYDDEIRNLGGSIFKLPPPSQRGFIGAINDIRIIIRKNGPYNAVHTHMLFNSGIAMIAAYLSKVKIRVSHAHTTADNCRSFYRKLYILAMRILIKLFSNEFLACSNIAGEYLFGKKIINNSKYKMLPNFIDYEKITSCNSSDIRKELNIKADDIVVGHIGRFITAKNHKFLIDVINEMIVKNKKVKAVLVGIGDNEDIIKKKVKDLGIEENIKFLGIRNDIPNILKSIDLFILPSISEGLGLVLLESQASITPCLVSEAIQPEADLGVNLLYKLNLSDDSKIWAEEAFNIIAKNNVKNINIINAIKEKGYDLGSILNNLNKVYKSNLQWGDKL